MKIAFIGFPLALGADRKGVELAPDYFRKAGVIEMMNEIAGCYDLAMFNLPLLLRANMQRIQK